MLRDGGVVHARGVEDGQLPLGGEGHVDLVETDSVFADHLELRERLLDHCPGDGIVTTEEGIELLPGKLKHALFGKRASFPHDVPALGSQEFVVGAGCVLVGGGGEEDFHNFQNSTFTLQGRGGEG